jgi:hypothetical protein
MKNQKTGDATWQFEKIPLFPVGRIDLMIYQQHSIEQIYPKQNVCHRFYPLLL